MMKIMINIEEDNKSKKENKTVYLVDKRKQLLKNILNYKVTKEK